MGSRADRFGEIDEILADTNEKTSDFQLDDAFDEGGTFDPEGEGVVEGWPGHPTADGHTFDCCGDTCSRECACDTCPPVDGESMTPDPKPDSYYAGGLAPTTIPVMTVMLEKLRIELKQHVSPAILEQMTFGNNYDPITDKVMMELGMYLFSNQIHTETTKEDFPAGWFQGFKESLFPSWLKRKFPVKYTQIFKEVKTIHVCPHLNYRTRDEERFHLQFLMPEGDLSRYSA